jgi:predicted short-subunit dehydrogenase-like oxidoreductase (DUF2520 family)
VAAFHPVRAFATRDGGRGGLEAAAIGIETTDDATYARLIVFASSLGGRPFRLPGGSRDLYHAAAALAGNAPLALIDIAERAFVAAGAPPALAREALIGLAAGALANAARLGPAAALTGPVVRGDVDVVARHLSAFAARDPTEAELYASLSAALARLAASRDDAARSRAVRDLLARALDRRIEGEKR